MNTTLYRQYRPQKFAELEGQDAVRTILQNALARDRVAHAYLFCGPRGTGKTTTARILARAITCEKPIKKDVKGQAEYEPCNECASCTSQLAERATDIIEIDAASNRGIEDIRQLRDQAQYLPIALSHKVYTIDEVHMLTPDAFNALLKTLEEPPAHCVFILATTEPQKVPATIRSRCQLIRFERAHVAAITRKLEKIIAKEGWEVEDGVVPLIADHAGGAFRDAEGLLQQLTTRYQPLTVALCSEALGISDDALITSLLDAALAGDSLATRDALTPFEINDQHACELVMSSLIERLRRLIQTCNDPEQLVAYTKAFTLLLEGYILIKGSPHPRLVLEATCLEIAAREQYGIKPEPKPDKDIPRPATPERVAVPAPIVEIKPVTTPAAPVAPVVELREAAIPDVRQAWKEVIKAISRDSAPLAQMLREAVIHTTENNVLTLHVGYKFSVEKLAEKKNRQKVEGLLHQITHSVWQVHYELTDSLPKQGARKAIGGSSAVEAAASVFGG